jgi:hypothetical protein
MKMLLSHGFKRRKIDFDILSQKYGQDRNRRHDLHMYLIYVINLIWN